MLPGALCVFEILYYRRSIVLKSLPATSRRQYSRQSRRALLVKTRLDFDIGKERSIVRGVVDWAIVCGVYEVLGQEVADELFLLRPP